MSETVKKLNSMFYIIFFIAGWSTKSLTQNLTKDDITLYKDIVYTIVDGHELTLDIAVPKYLDSPAPAIVDIPGGAWRRINKSAEDALFYAMYGFIGVSITHRTSDIAIFPAAVHDCKCAVRWLRAHAEKYHINPDKIGVTGVSSGGHLAALLGTSGDDNYLEGKGDYLKYSSRVQAVVDHFGPTDFMKMNDTTGLGLSNFLEHFKADSPESLFLGGPLKEKTELARLANPITYIDSEDSPMFIGHGEKDGMVIIKQSELLFDALKRAGVPTEFVRVKNADHMYRPIHWDVEVNPGVDEMNQMGIRWFEKWLGKPEINANAIPHQEGPNAELSSKKYRLFYRLTVDTPGKTEKSYCKGRFKILCEGNTLAQGEINLVDLSTEEKRMFQQNTVLSGVDLGNKEIMWNFQGEIFDSELNEKFEPMYMQGEKYDNSIEGIGFNIQIGKNNMFNIVKKVYRNKE
jgi:acetyl esterase/lipase